jgi:hypothetical protein
MGKVNILWHRAFCYYRNNFSDTITIFNAKERRKDVEYKRNEIKIDMQKYIDQEMQKIDEKISIRLTEEIKKIEVLKKQEQRRKEMLAL